MAQTTWTSHGTTQFSPKLSAEMREQALPFWVFRQFAKTHDGLGKGRGDTVQFTKRLRVDVQGGTLVETATVPSNQIKFVKDSIVVTEYGNAVEATEKVLTLSEFTLDNEFNSGLVDDQKTTLDSAVATEFQSAQYRAVCSTTDSTVFTTNGAQTITASTNPSDKNIRRIVEYMKKRHIPKMGNHYIGILSVEAMGGVYDTLQAIAQYAEPSYRLNDEVGRYYGVRFVEDNAILSNTIGNGSAYGEGLIFGDEAVSEAVAVPEELRFEVDDLGRSKKYAWYAILGWKKTWHLATDDSNSTNAGIERIVRIFSA